MLPILPADATTLEISPISYKLRCIGLWCSGSRGRMPPPPTGLMLIYPTPKASTPTAPTYLAAVESPPNGGPTCGGSLLESAQSGESLPRYLIQTIGPPVRPPCKTCQRSRCMPPPRPKSLTSLPSSDGPISNWTLPPANNPMTR